MADVTGTVKGTSGDFSWKVKPGAGDKGQDLIKIKYKPHAGVACSDIRFIQSCKTIGLDKDGNRIAKNDDEIEVNAGDNPFKYAKTDWVINPGGVSVYIDHLKCEDDPFYNGPEEAGSSPPPQKSAMEDDPRDMRGVKPEAITVIYIFETCAFCVDTGQCLDCFAWICVMTRTSPGKITVVTPNGGASLPPTDSWKEALEKFVQNHTRTDNNGKIVWYCPETGATDGEVPGGFRRAVIPHYTPPPIQDGMLHPQDRPVRPKIPIPGRGGNGEFAALATVLAAALRSPANAAAKFTWSGAQKKTIPGLVLTALPRLTGQDIAPFVPREARFTNDRMDLRWQHVTVGFMSALLSALGKYRRDVSSGEGAVTFTLIANLGGRRPIAVTGALQPAWVSSLVKSLAPHAKGDRGTLAALGFLTLNMGTDSRIAIDEEKSRITVPKPPAG